MTKLTIFETDDTGVSHTSSNKLAEIEVFEQLSDTSEAEASYEMHLDECNMPDIPVPTELIDFVFARDGKPEFVALLGGRARSLDGPTPKWNEFGHYLVETGALENARNGSEHPGDANESPWRSSV